MSRSPNSSVVPPLGAASGLLAGCGITLLGVVLGLSPELILLRALTGGCIVGVVVALIAVGWKLVSPVEEDD